MAEIDVKTPAKLIARAARDADTTADAETMVAEQLELFLRRVCDSITEEHPDTRFLVRRS